MSEELEFLIKDNILDAEICEIEDANGKETVGLSLVVGLTDEMIQTMQDENPELDLSNVLGGMEVIISEPELKQVLKLIKVYKS